MEMKKAQIGRCGELLVQYRLLSHGIESAPMTTDSGIDLVAYLPMSKTPITIQVKTNLKPKPAGGRGTPTLNWRVTDNTPAQYIAAVDLSTERIWFFTHEQFKCSFPQYAEQANMRNAWMFVEIYPTTNMEPPIYDYHFEEYLLERVIPQLVMCKSPSVELSQRWQSP